jgi:hypothetical protein
MSRHVCVFSVIFKLNNIVHQQLIKILNVVLSQIYMSLKFDYRHVNISQIILFGGNWNVTHMSTPCAPVPCTAMPPCRHAAQAAKGIPQCVRDVSTFLARYHLLHMSHQNRSFVHFCVVSVLCTGLRKTPGRSQLPLLLQSDNIYCQIREEMPSLYVCWSRSFLPIRD